MNFCQIYTIISGVRIKVVFMAVKMDKFLLQYFMQLHFNEMPPEKRETFIKYIEGGDDFTKDSDMKIWKRDLVHQDANGKWVDNEIPDGNAPTPPAAPAPTPARWSKTRSCRPFSSAPTGR